jgi:hypothetical protein
MYPENGWISGYQSGQHKARQKEKPLIYQGL